MTVPAFLVDTPAGNAERYGWYRATFTLPDDRAGKPVELQFGGVDEQAWVYVNGQPVGEHTLDCAASIGLALYPENANTLTGLLREADQAMYRAKARCRGVADISHTDLLEKAV